MSHSLAPKFRRKAFIMLRIRARIRRNLTDTPMIGLRLWDLIPRFWNWVRKFRRYLIPFIREFSRMDCIFLPMMNSKCLKITRTCIMEVKTFRQVWHPFRDGNCLSPERNKGRIDMVFENSAKRKSHKGDRLENGRKTSHAKHSCTKSRGLARFWRFFWKSQMKKEPVLCSAKMAICLATTICVGIMDSF